MTCPDENTIARILTGGANADERAKFHQHLDQCPECLQLISILGGLEESSAKLRSQWVPAVSSVAKDADAQQAQERPRVAKTALAPQQTDLPIALVVMGLAQLVSAMLLLPACHQFLARYPVAFSGFSTWYFFRSLWVAFVEVSLAAGPAWALVILFALRTKRPWALIALPIYAWLALPTLFWGPIAICILFQLRSYRQKSVTQ
jgi:hypothetical protein